MDCREEQSPSEWGKYLISDTVSDGWAAENEVVELPKTPEPTPSVTTPAPTPSESQTLPPAPTESGTPTVAPTQPSINSFKTPETYTNLAHTGSMAAPIIEASVVMLAAGLTIALKKRNSI